MSTEKTFTIKWTVEDIQSRAIEKETIITKEQCVHILENLENHYDPKYGVTFETIDFGIDEILTAQSKITEQKVTEPEPEHIVPPLTGYLATPITIQDNQLIKSSSTVEYDLKSLLTEYNFYEIDRSEISKLHAGSKMKALHHTNKDNGMETIIITPKISKAFEEMRFTHHVVSNGDILGDKDVEIRSPYDMWENDPTFMDGGDACIIKLKVGETLLREDSSGYFNLTKRVK